MCALKNRVKRLEGNQPKDELIAWVRTSRDRPEAEIREKLDPLITEKYPDQEYSLLRLGSNDPDELSCLGVCTGKQLSDTIHDIQRGKAGNKRQPGFGSWPKTEARK